jgi:hypothetical protein
MNLFCKKTAMFTAFAFGATFLMSFEQNSNDYGQSVQVYSTTQTIKAGDKVAITGLVRALVGVTRAAVRTATHLTPEIEQMTPTMGVTNSDVSDVELKNEKLYNLD